MNDFGPVEAWIVRYRPDYDRTRQSHATANKQTVSSAWVAELLELSGMGGVDRRQVVRWRQKGIGMVDADSVSRALGEHSSVLWPDWYPEDFMRGRRRRALAESRQLREVS